MANRTEPNAKDMHVMDIDPLQVPTIQIENVYPLMWENQVSKRTSGLREKTLHGFNKNWKIILAKVILILIVSLFDFGSDTKVGLYLQHNHPIWSALTFVLIFFPGVIVGIFSLLSFKKIRRYQNAQDQQTEMKHLDFGFIFFILISTIAFPIGVIVSQTLEIMALVFDESELIKPISYITNGMMGLEAFLESGPQTILQFYIMFKTKHISIT